MWNEYERNQAKFAATVEAGYKLLVYIFDKKYLDSIETHTKDDLVIQLFLR